MNNITIGGTNFSQGFVSSYPNKDAFIADGMDRLYPERNEPARKRCLEEVWLHFNLEVAEVETEDSQVNAEEEVNTEASESTGEETVKPQMTKRRNNGK